MKQTYYMPTRIVMGENCVAGSAELLKNYGNKALIVTGAHSAKSSGALGDLLSALSASRQSYAVYDRVANNPPVACCYEGAALARDEGADFVIAVGGGSPMDAGKAIALLARQDIAPERLFCRDYTPDVLPVVCVPTTAGTGSEVTQYAVLTNDAARTKMSIASPLLFPRAALLDAKYLASLSRTTLINTVLDALSHAVEGMLSARSGSITDALARESIARICVCFASIGTGRITDGERRSLLTASTLAGMVIANTGTTAVHAMGYPLTYFRGIDHGRANALLLPAFLAFVAETRAERVAEILACCGMHSLTQLSAAIDALLGEKETLAPEEVAAYSAAAMRSKNIRNCMAVPDEAAVAALYRSSLPESK